MKTIPPFFANTKDDTHCFQAALKMVFKHFEPENDYSFEELDIFTGKKHNLYTWPTKTFLEIQKRGYDIVVIETFDYVSFSKSPEEYLLVTFGEEVSKDQIANSDIPYEVILAAEFAKNGVVEHRIPTVQDIYQLLDKGYLVGCNINSRALNNKEGYVGHFVLLYDYDRDNNEIYLHDPGSPAFASRVVSEELFKKSWEYPNENACNVFGIRK